MRTLLEPTSKVSTIHLTIKSLAQAHNTVQEPKYMDLELDKGDSPMRPKNQGMGIEVSNDLIMVQQRFMIPTKQEEGTLVPNDSPPWLSNLVIKKLV